MLVLLKGLHLVSLVLEPDLHLLRSQVEHLRELITLGRGEVSLLFESSLQLEHLRLEVLNKRPASFES